MREISVCFGHGLRPLQLVSFLGFLRTSFRLLPLVQPQCSAATAAAATNLGDGSNSHEDGGMRSPS